jgi:hypothetical protein
MATFEPVTDPSVLAQLNAPAAPVAAPPPGWQPVTDPGISWGLSDGRPLLKLSTS